jgi:predicted phosphodiesterase
VGLILCVNDIHAAGSPPSSCTETYWPDLLDLLGQTVKVAEDRGVRAVAWAGDVFHHKAPSRTPHGVVQDLIRIISGYPCEVWGVIGNHDIQHDRLASVDVTQPLGVLFQSGLRRLEGWAGDLPLYGVPWQQEWSAKGIYKALEDFRDGMTGRSLVVTHAPVYPPGREPRYPGAEFTPAQWWATGMDGPGACHGLLYGHIHEPHGAYRVAGFDTRFCNPGALSRGSLDEYNLHRQVSCALWDSQTGEFEVVPLQARPAEQVFRLRQHEAAVTARQSLEDFLSGVDGAVLDCLSVESVLAGFREQGVDPAVIDLAEELFGRVQEAAQ